MPTIVWILVWAAIGAAIAILVFRERRAGKDNLDFDADLLRGQADAEARTYRDFREPGAGGMGIDGP